MTERSSEKSAHQSASEMSGEADLRDTEVAGPKPAATLKSSAVNEGVMSARGPASPRPDGMAAEVVEDVVHAV
jgi:hypothetical protein